MGSPAPATEQNRFWAAAAVAVVLTAIFALLLQPGFGLPVRQTASSLGLLTAGVLAAASGGRRALRSDGLRRRAWSLLTVAAMIAIAGNVWLAATDTGSVSTSPTASDVAIAIALLLSIAGLLSFPTVKRRGAELLLMALDGLVAAGALIIIVSVLVYSDLLTATVDDSSGTRFFSLLFPVLDVVLATVAVLLILRSSGGDRPALTLVATGFLLYAVSDLAFADLSAQNRFEFGSLLDLGWIAGYLTLSLAAWYPTESGPAGSRAGGGLSDAFGTTLVFAVLLAAAVVQVIFGAGGDMVGYQAGLWLTLIIAAGARQIVLTADNASLRHGLELRVEEQTADLRRLARQTEVLLTSVGDGIYGVDHEGRVTFINPSGAEALGYTPEQLDGRRAHELFHAADEHGTAFPWSGCYVYEALHSGAVANAEEDTYIRADGTSFPVEITASPLLDESALRGAVVVFRDVTQRREVDRMKNEFLSVVSHELRTPLTSIRGSLGLLAGGRLGELPARADSLVTVALQSSERLTRLINDLLDIERIESGIRPMDVVALESCELIAAATRQIEGMASTMAVEVVIESANGRVLADEDRILQTLTNLLGNALKYSEPGGTVWVDAAPLNDEVLFRVRDQGRGIPEDKLETIFERFEQVDSSDSRRIGGTGLGLAISRGIVERHGGRIWAESEVGVGTTVQFTLPAARPTPLLGLEELDGSATVLVCDDDEAVVESLSALLRHHGYQPIGVTDGATAIRLIDQQHPAAVLLDLMMPGTTGAQVLAALRSRPETRHIPVIVVSGLGPEDEPSVAESTEGWLIKPVSEQRLVQTVALAVSGREHGATVLLVEDDEGLASVVGTMLAAEGLEVVHAATAADAVLRGREQRPDVIVLDLHLRGGDGAAVVAEFRRHGPMSHIPLIVYSAADVEDARRHSLELGETVFLTKGRTSPDQLKDRVLGLVNAVTAKQGDQQ